MAATSFLSHNNFGLTMNEKLWPDILSQAGIKTGQATEPFCRGKRVVRHKPDISLLSLADLNRPAATGGI